MDIYKDKYNFCTCPMGGPHGVGDVGAAPLGGAVGVLARIDGDTAGDQAGQEDDGCRDGFGGGGGDLPQPPTVLCKMQAQSEAHYVIVHIAYMFLHVWRRFACSVGA